MRRRKARARAQQPRQVAKNTSRAPVFSYHGQRDEQIPAGQRGLTKNGVVKRLSSSHRVISLWHGLIAIFVIISLGFATRLDATPKFVFEQKASTSLIRSPETYKKAAESILKKSSRNQNKLAFNRGGFIEQMKKQFPELDTIDVRIPLLGHLPVVVISRVKQPAFILKNSTAGYIIDDTGRAIISSDEAPSSVTDKLIVVSDQSGISLQPNVHILPQETVHFIQVIQAQLAAKQLTISKIDLPLAAQEAHLRIAGQGYYIKLTTDGDPRQQVGRFIATRQKLEKDGVVPKEYIDVRVEEKVFYK